MGSGEPASCVVSVSKQSFLSSRLSPSLDLSRPHRAAISIYSLSARLVTADAAALVCGDCAAGQYSGSLVNGGSSYCTPTSRCQACFGDCDTDSDCLPGLTCFQRAGNEAVPGCSGSGSATYDFCYSESIGPFSCTSCAPGRFSSTVRAASSEACTDCIAGRFQPEDGAAFCVLCAEGKYSTTAAAVSETACSLCAAGQFQGSTGQSACIACASGRFSITSGGPLADSCIGCSPGEFQPRAGETSCRQCTPGYFSDTAAATTCSACRAGRYKSATGAEPPVEPTAEPCAWTAYSGYGTVSGVFLLLQLF